MTKEKLNFSLLFLLPLCSEKNEKWKSYTAELYPYKIEGSLVNAFAKDINKPWLDNHVFLVFDKSDNDEAIDEMLVIKDSFVTKYDYRIDGKFYSIYAFSATSSKIISKDYDNIMNGDYVSISVDSKERIKSFWGAAANSNVSLILEGKVRPNTPQDEIIPEADDLDIGWV